MSYLLRHRGEIRAKYPRAFGCGAKRFCLVVLALLVGSLQFSGDIRALSAAQLQVLQENILYFNTANDCGYNDGVLADTGGSTSGVWNSGLSPPYIVEQYAINVLEDLAQKKGKPSSDAVTQQHVLALVAWALVEGGDINNSDLYNLYNTALMDSDLDPTMQSTGSPAYGSFDDGVEATARTLAAGHGGMVAVLLDPSSTAEDFAHAESYSGTSSYPGTNEWAGAAYSDPAAYESNWDIVLQSVKSNYMATAALIIGTPTYEALYNETDPSKLSNINSAGFGTTPVTAAASGSCDSASGNSIVQEAVSLAWDTPGHGPNESDATPAYQKAMPEYDGAIDTFPYSDCGVFVATVMIATGADPDYPKRGTDLQMAYLESSNKYKEIPNINSTSNLQPGDIFVNSQHTFIYTGPLPGGYNQVEASLYGHVPEVDTTFFASANGERFQIFRLIQS